MLPSYHVQGGPASPHSERGHPAAIAHPAARYCRSGAPSRFAAVPFPAAHADLAAGCQPNYWEPLARRFP
jgi:hypothetical protein